MAVQSDVARRLFTADEFERMAALGIFGPEERVELIDGEIVEMSPIAPGHGMCVANLTTRLGTRKRRLYAEAGIQDYRVVSVADEWVEIHRSPEADAYRESRRVEPPTPSRSSPSPTCRSRSPISSSDRARAAASPRPTRSNGRPARDPAGDGRPRAARS